MISLVPNASPNDAKGAFAIIALLPDEAKEKFGARLKELSDAARRAEDAIKASGAAHDAAVAMKDEAERLHAALADREAAVAASEKAARDKGNELAEREGAVHANEQAHAEACAKRDAELNARQQKIEADEAAAQKKKAQADADADAAAKLRASYESKIAALRALVA